eukprot:752523-Hanusia_phi.AAC.1
MKAKSEALEAEEQQLEGADVKQEYEDDEDVKDRYDRLANDTKDSDSEEAARNTSLMPSAADAGIDQSEAPGADENDDGSRETELGEEASRKRKYDGWVPTAYGYVREKKDITAKPDEKKGDGEILSARYVRAMGVAVSLNRVMQREVSAAQGHEEELDL